MKIKNITKTRVRFSEVDSLGIVWHGHFVKYFEDGREAFGREFSLGYMDIYRNGYKAPIVNVNCDYKSVVKYDESICIETIYRDVPSAKIVFDFIIWNENMTEVKAKGESTQIFLDSNNELLLTIPQFFIDWKRNNGII